MRSFETNQNRSLEDRIFSRINFRGFFLLSLLFIGSAAVQAASNEQNKFLNDSKKANEMVRSRKMNE